MISTGREVLDGQRRRPAPDAAPSLRRELLERCPLQIIAGQRQDGAPFVGSRIFLGNFPGILLDDLGPPRPAEPLLAVLQLAADPVVDRGVVLQLIS